VRLRGRRRRRRGSGRRDGRARRDERLGPLGDRDLDAEGGGKIATFEVTATISPPSADIQPAAIHRVTCAEYDPQIPEGASLEQIFDAVSATAEDELGEVRDGKVRTTVPESLADRLTGEYSLIVHGPSPPYRPAVCGDIPRRD
jgi:hypothetical protein